MELSSEQPARAANRAAATIHMTNRYLFVVIMIDLLLSAWGPNSSRLRGTPEAAGKVITKNGVPAAGPP
jgi:hypothetical protein